ncbi:TIGR02117 family protein [Scytonema hofmannii FACHB-248]|uniref:TIGR02117 family protein n=1 Tax=Scytonema hofmannii FACHB-248 TaxID=1842502 RepID=A0ABR8GPB1_9CYAN|nr:MULTISPECIES: TIGR02117 family protein [Nostocales]MBD2605254.1 TIGR02117 family protein [Scytonema hofmannii FACHB-248]
MKYVKNLNLPRSLYRCFATIFFSLAFLCCAVLIPAKWGNHSKHHCEIKVCVSNTGIHTNIIVPTENKVFDWHKYLSIDEIGIDNATNYNYLSFGWGDRDFYMSTPSLANLKLSTTFKALFLPTPSVLYVKGYQTIPNYLEVKCIKINQTDYLQLINFIESSFQLDANGRQIRLGNGHTDNAGFYAAKGSYSILRNCNSWTAEGLTKADINTPLWSGVSSAIMFHLKSNCK